MLPWKFIVTRWSIPGLALLAGLGLLNAALLLAGDPISPIGMIHEKDAVGVATTIGATESPLEREQTLVRVVAAGAFPVLPSASEDGVSSVITE